MRYPHWFFAIGACGALTPCGAQVRDSAGIRIVTSTAPRWTDATALRVDAMPLLTLGSPQGAVQEQFGSVVDAARLSDGTIVVADGKNIELRLFDAGGKFLRTIGRKGQGPGDFQGPVTLFITPRDTIITWDMSGARLTSFDRDGHVLRTATVQNPPVQTGPGGHPFGARRKVIGRFGDGSMMATQIGHLRFDPPAGMYQDSVVLSHVEPARVTENRTIFTNEEWDYHKDGSVYFDARPFGRTGAIAFGVATFIYSDGSEYAVREFSPDGKLLRVIRLARPIAPVTAADIKSYKNTSLAAASDKEKVIQAEIDAWIAYPKMMPAFDSLQVDASGRVWARIYAKSDAPRRWDVFAPDGGYLGAVTLPARIDVLRIGADYILARAKGADDEESIRVYWLH